MMPPAFEYYAPTGVDEVIDLLEKYGDDAKILAGGQSLIPLLKSRITEIPYLISLSGVKDLSYITESSNATRIGAMTVDSDLEYSDTIRKRYPILMDALARLADPLVRNMGTVGGNISHGDPSNDLPAVMLALKATFVARGRGGDRNIKARDFFIDTFTTALEHDEVLTGISIPVWKEHSGGSYVKFERGTWNFSVAGSAVQLRLENGAVAEAGIAITSMGPKAMYIPEAEDYLLGKKFHKSVISEAADIVVEKSQPSPDTYGSVEYKKNILKRITMEALENAFRRSGGMK